MAPPLISDFDDEDDLPSSPPTSTPQLPMLRESSILEPASTASAPRPKLPPSLPVSLEGSDQAEFPWPVPAPTNFLPRPPTQQRKQVWPPNAQGPLPQWLLDATQRETVWSDAYATVRETAAARGRRKVAERVGEGDIPAEVEEPEVEEEDDGDELEEDEADDEVEAVEEEAVE